MASGLADAIRLLVQDKGISEELVKKTIEDFLLAAYKRKYNTTENAVVRFSENGEEVSLFARKEIVEEVMDPALEIALEDALKLNDECEIGDELLIEVNPQEFDRVAVQSAKQKARQDLREIQKDTLYSEYKDKVGEMIIGYYQRERNGNIFVDLGKIEGLLPRRFQSPRESYRPNDRIRAYIHEVTKAQTGLQIILSRTHPEFVRKIFELEVPEIYDGTVEIFKIVREPGYRTKLAVYANRGDVDPVGACVGLKGVRIQSIVRELEGEKIDILKYDTDPRNFIKNALSPAQVSQVIILDEPKRNVLAIVPDDQLSLAIGKQGLNVRLANRLVDWNIDVKTEAQFAEMDISNITKAAVNNLFSDIEEDEEIERVGELPGIPDRIVATLAKDNIEYIEDLVSLSEEQLAELPGLDQDDIDLLRKTIEENLEIVEDEVFAPAEEQPAEDLEDEYDEPSGEGEEAEDDETQVLEENEKDAYYGDDDFVEYEEDDETLISELPGVPETAIKALGDYGITTIVDFLSRNDDELAGIPGLDSSELDTVQRVIAENVEIIEEEDEE
ncbi:transcription termination factor NusA [Spirochaeta lutea]|uniref:Transcription termination/antitermination protein NusA n=1 Tax=Spirochaeta lutea TaxID=1480694 RepID=A0A098R2F3_9SPIO|nr:transcription termination factor NusA [Spirochaeta lutea]KGE73976.1 transcription elongation factor NusA [Spirochaeta lutea]